MKSPYIINFQHTGSAEFGYLDIAEVGKTIPFEVKRMFWTHSVPNGIVRGNHAHKATEQILIAIEGRIIVTTEMPDGQIDTFELTSSTQGIYLPPHVWHRMEYHDNAVQIVFCSGLFEEADYLREYTDYKEYYK
ncbi:FdtA/QdtA family cupin domain-containing protein [Pedobacter gandavensis]|uniref:sugar 3,4-ketoisomerase n=1 Tax=Pedobacter gandavensis TaxID=2679963 RepID=UPI0029308522|nr:FdtA/QdtA family cupin domain-containing protein [Pedobacter gandavensis]